MKQRKKGGKAVKVLIIIAIVIAVIAVGVFALLKATFLKSFPVLKGEPEIGKWYEVTVDGSKSSDGSEWHGIFRKGTENKVVVYFFGGGVSITPETSKGGNKFFATNMTAQDFVAQGGIGSDAEDNPFRDWNFIVIPYATGDFHAGTGVYEGNRTVYPEEPEAGIRRYCGRLAKIYKREESIGGLPINMEGFRLFDTEHRSSKPLCLAYKAAQLAAPDKADAFLTALRHATVLDCRPTTHFDEIINVVCRVGIDESAFTKQYKGEAESALAADLTLTRRLSIYSLPSYLISRGDRAVMMRSFDYRDFENAIEKISR